jgi:Tol biopolymer transport system component
VTVPPTSGTLEVTTSTSGGEQDPDGYTVQVDGASAQAIGAAATLTTSDVTAGSHTVHLGEVAANCSVSGDNPRTVSIAGGEVTKVVFAVTCNSTTGTLVVTSSSSGFFPDPDGYLITVDGESRGALDGSAQQTLDNVPVGVHQIGLSGLIANCRVQGQNPRPQEIVGGASVDVAFEVECAPPAIAFRSTRSTPWMSIHLINPDGSGLVRLPSTTHEHHPVWSPDGRRLAFVASGDGLYVMTPGEGDRRRLFPNDVSMARWSPDGSMIAFGDGEQLWIVHTDGTGLRKLAGGSQAAWSPDGRTIAFRNDQGLFTIGSDGSGLKQLTVPLLGQPEEATWSPDGSRLAFSAFVSSNPYANAIFTMNQDGTGLVRLTPEGGSDVGPKWSPDGSRIAFRMELMGPTDGTSGLGVMNSDGSGRSIVAGQELYFMDFTWSPDGGSIAFTVDMDFEIGDNDVYVVNLDGSGLRNLTRNRAGDAQPSWGFR